MALSGTSPALDAIPVGAIATDETTPLCPASGTTDQRDVVRPQAGWTLVRSSGRGRLTA